MEDLENLCNEAKAYPKNFASKGASRYTLDAIHKRLDDQEDRLFHTESYAALSFLEFDSDSEDFWHTCVKNAGHLRTHLRIRVSTPQKDPWCRFLFVHAPHSRERLKTTREMLMLSFTYLQVIPEFVDFLIPFGKQNRAQDFHFSGFRQRTWLSSRHQGLAISELGWSGHELQLCYNLKSVERSSSQPDWPWSIRHFAVHHTFDCESVRTTWIIIKGDQQIEKRIESMTGDPGSPEMTSFETIDKAFAATLATHLILCEWSAENWRWFINFLEEKFQDISRRSLSHKVDLPPLSPRSEAEGFQTPLRSQTQGTEKSMVSKFSRSRTQTMESRTTEAQKHPPTTTQIYTHPGSGLTQPLPPGVSMKSTQLGDQVVDQSGNYGQQEFSFPDLQKIQHIEEKAHESALVLKMNLKVISQLKGYYMSLVRSEDLPAQLTQGCKEDLNRFQSRVESVQNDVEMQMLRIETLLRLLGDRKTLLYGILDCCNIEVNRLLAHESRSSTKNMEHMTKDMNEIARKTKTETVSMKIITLVTLFFLPGTFISVGRILSSTLMSTDIIHFESIEGGRLKRNFQSGALQLYLELTIPFMFATFLVWAAFQWWQKRKEKLRKENLLASMREV